MSAQCAAATTTASVVDDDRPRGLESGRMEAQAVGATTTAYDVVENPAERFCVCRMGAQGAGAAASANGDGWPSGVRAIQVASDVYSTAAALNEVVWMRKIVWLENSMRIALWKRARVVERTAGLSKLL